MTPLEVEVVRLRQALADAEQQLRVLRPGGRYAWKSKHDDLLATLKAVRACLTEPFVDVGGAARQYVKAICLIQDAIVNDEETR